MMGNTSIFAVIVNITAIAESRLPAPASRMDIGAITDNLGPGLGINASNFAVQDNIGIVFDRPNGIPKSIGGTASCRSTGQNEIRSGAGTRNT